MDEIVDSAITKINKNQDDSLDEKEKIQRLQLLEKEIKDLQKENKPKNSYKEIAKNYRDDFPEKTWIKEFPKPGNEDRIAAFEAQSAKQRITVEETRSIPVNDLIERASHGLALKGVLVGDSVDDCIKRSAIVGPLEVVVTQPDVREIEKEVIISSTNQFDELMKSLTSLGFGITLLGNVSKLGLFKFKGKLSWEVKTEKQEIKEHHQQEFSKSVWKVHIVIASSCQITPESLQLSPELISKLVSLEDKLMRKKSWDSIKKLCHDDILIPYGSHINVGTIQLGGILLFAENFRNTKEVSTQQQRAKMENDTEVDCTLAMPIIPLNVGGSLDTGTKYVGVQSNQMNEKSEENKRLFLFNKVGGPDGVNDLTRWKSLLKEYNTTWAIINREMGDMRDYVAIWDLILDKHKGEFFDSRALASYLQNTWQELYNNSVVSLEDKKLDESYVKLDNLYDEINTFNSTNMDSNQHIEVLEKIHDLIQDIRNSTETYKFLIMLLRTSNEEKNLSNILLRFIEKEKDFTKGDLIRVKYLVNVLMSYTGEENFPDKNKIQKWIKSKDNFSEYIIDGSELGIPELVKYLEKQLAMMFSNHQTFLDNSAMSEVISFINKLRNSLKNRNKDHELFFVKILLRSWQVDWTNVSIKDYISLAELKETAEIIQTRHRIFVRLSRDKPIDELEAFLIHVLLSDSKERASLSEDEFLMLISDIKPFLSKPVKEILSRYIYSTPFNWSEMLYHIDFFYRGESPSTKSKSFDFTGIPNSLTKIDNSNNVEQINSEDSSLSEILKALDLEEYYPSKLTLEDALKLKKPKGIGWVFLDKLLMNNFEARDSMFLEVNDEPAADSSFLSSLTKKKVDSMGSSIKSQMSTLDIVSAIFGCCSNFLRQLFVKSLFECKLAIPLVLPLSPNELLFPLYALRIIHFDHISSKKRLNKKIIEMPLPIVTFIRLGRPKFSKSRFMNYLINTKNHDTFLHHECTNGQVPRKITDGLVECAWLLPDEQSNTEPTLFLNLRGDGVLFPKQVTILKKISTIIVIIIDLKEVSSDPSYGKLCRDIITECKNVGILLTSNCDNKEELEKDGEGFVSSIGQENLGKFKEFTFFPVIQKKENLSSLKEKTKIFFLSVTKAGDRIAIKDCKDLMKRQGICVDEDNEDYNNATSYAQKIFDLLKDKDKTEIFPLQTGLWLEYSKLLKDLFRIGSSSNHSTFHLRHAEIRQQLTNIRRQQQRLLRKSMPPVIDLFFLAIQNFSSNQDHMLYFLNWLKQLLDDHSRQVLPKLRQEIFDHYLLHRRTSNLGYEILGDEPKSLRNASIGLENIFREIGQIYESTFEKQFSNGGEVIDQHLHMLPEVVANLLLKGIPLELVDGEASNVPLTWIKAVLDNLSKLTNDAKIFVISVLGIQSSGKSTLLNTMFGIQLPVSAGRCTIGAYLQILPVDKSTDLPFDYIFIVDTEGLRASERGEMMLKSDNEMTTLVIGLADFTLINIKGENTTEINEVLQIAIQAFLRMKAIEDKLKSPRSCFFVHQNVPGSDSSGALLFIRQNLEENLDFITKEAAREERVFEIDSFNQVIRFNLQKSIHFFPDLWLGVPPMSPVSSAYSSRANELKWIILNDISKTHGSFMTVSDFSIRIKDMWEAILTEDFVFSFCNTVEVRAYNKLEKKFFNIVLNLEEAASIRTKEARIILETCNNISQLESCLQNEELQLVSYINSKHDELRLSLDQYFQSDDLKGKLIKWQHAKTLSLRATAEEQILQSRKELQAFMNACKIDLDQKENKERTERKIQKRAVELASKLKGKDYTKDVLEEHFNDMWIDIQRELLIPTLNKEDSIVSIIEKSLFACFGSHNNWIKTEIIAKPFDPTLKLSSLKPFQIEDRDITFKSKIKKIMCSFEDVDSSKRALRGLVVIIFEKVEEVLLNFSSSIAKIGISFIKNIITIVQNEVNAFKHKEFEISHNFQERLAVYMCRYCLPCFVQNEKLYKEMYSPEIKLNQYKEKCRILFKNEMNDSSDELKAKDLFFDDIIKYLNKAVFDSVPNSIVRKVQEDISLKSELIFAILKDLAQQADFYAFCSYLKNAEKYAFKWMLGYIEKTIFRKEDEDSPPSDYEELIFLQIEKFFTSLYKALKTTKEDVSKMTQLTMSSWVRRFCDNFKDFIGIRESSFNFISTINVTRFENFQDLIFAELNDLKSNVKKNFVTQVEWMSDVHVHISAEKLIYKLWGCPAQCPFCHEPCKRSDRNHYSISSKDLHSCIQHKPDGLGGIRWDTTSDLGVNLCGFNIVSNYLYSYGANSSKHKYKWKENWKKPDYTDNFSKYKKYFPDWHINPEHKDTTTKYWKWFMSKFRFELGEYYNCRQPEIPAEWEEISLEEALVDLEQVYGSNF